MAVLASQDDLSEQLDAAASTDGIVELLLLPDAA